VLRWLDAVALLLGSMVRQRVLSYFSGSTQQKCRGRQRAAPIGAFGTCELRPRPPAQAPARGQSPNTHAVHARAAAPGDSNRWSQTEISKKRHSTSYEHATRSDLSVLLLSRVFTTSPPPGAGRYVLAYSVRPGRARRGPAARRRAAPTWHRGPGTRSRRRPGLKIPIRNTNQNTPHGGSARRLGSAWACSSVEMCTRPPSRA
jgi:hypothetical protein